MTPNTEHDNRQQHSIETSAHSGGAVAQIINGMRSIEPKEWLVILLVGFLAVMNAALWVNLSSTQAQLASVLREKAVKEDLRRWDMDQFKSHEFLVVQSDVQVAKGMAQAALVASQSTCKR